MSVHAKAAPTAWAARLVIMRCQTNAAKWAIALNYDGYDAFGLPHALRPSGRSPLILLRLLASVVVRFVVCCRPSGRRHI